SWDNLVMAIGSTSITLKMEDVVDSLISEEMRRKVSLNSKEDSRVFEEEQNNGENMRRSVAIPGIRGDQNPL
ncbi:hypothetical protein KI387_023481, partial [Taxus chinensis]